jgi:starch phosphorylase
MVEQYFTKFYERAYERRNLLMKDNWKEAKSLTSWKKKVKENWSQLKFVSIENGDSTDLKVGTAFELTAKIDLGSLTPDDVEVQVYYGSKDKQNIPHANSFTAMRCTDAKEGKVYVYKGFITCKNSGEYGYTLRIVPKHEMLITPFELGVVSWA